MNRGIGLIALMLAGVATPALAQDGPNAPELGAQTEAPPTGGDRITIGVGAAVLPSYEGSNDYVVIPGGGLQGTVSGHAFSTTGTQLSVDAIPQNDPLAWHFELGPTIGVRLNRTGRIVDDQVRALGKLKAALEVGGFVGITKTGVITSDYDSFDVRVTVVHDVTDIYGGTIITPSIGYSTPLSTTSFVGVSASADFVDDRYGRTYFSVDAPGSLKSGLPVFKADGGLKSYTLGLTGAQSLSGDLRHGFSVFALGAYTRLLNDFSASPLVSQRGNPNQWFGGLGLGYTF